MDEHLDSHQQAQVVQPANVVVGQVQQAQVQVVPSQETDKNVVTWEASERVDYANGGLWLAGMILGGLAISGVVYLITQSYGSTIVVALMLFAVILYSRLKPGNVRYTISDYGISVDDNNYAYSEFKSYSFIVNDGVASVFLVPMQRFMVPITMYVAPENQSQVAELLSQHLPNMQRQPDFLDKLTAKLRL